MRARIPFIPARLPVRQLRAAALGGPSEGQLYVGCRCSRVSEWKGLYGPSRGRSLAVQDQPAAPLRHLPGSDVVPVV